MWLYSNSFLDKMVVFTLETDNPFSKSGMRSVCMGIYNGANISSYLWINSLRKLPTFGDATTGFPTKWRLRNERRNSILMTRHFPDLGSASDWLSKISHAARPFRSTARAQIWVVTRHQWKDSFLSLVTRMHACRLNSQYKSIWCTLLLDLLAFINSLAWKTADIWRHYRPLHWFPRQMTSEKRAQKFHFQEPMHFW